MVAIEYISVLHTSNSAVICIYIVMWIQVVHAMSNVKNSDTGWIALILQQYSLTWFDWSRFHAYCKVLFIHLQSYLFRTILLCNNFLTFYWIINNLFITPRKCNFSGIFIAVFRNKLLLPFAFMHTLTTKVLFIAYAGDYEMWCPVMFCFLMHRAHRFTKYIGNCH